MSEPRIKQGGPGKVRRGFFVSDRARECAPEQPALGKTMASDDNKKTKTILAPKSEAAAKKSVAEKKRDEVQPKDKTRRT